MFNAYKCPNGLPPSECRHIPQLVKNSFSFFSRLLAPAPARVKEPAMGRDQERWVSRAPAAAQQRTKTRSRG